MLELTIERDRIAKLRDEAWAEGRTSAQNASIFEKLYKMEYSKRLAEEEKNGVYSKSNLSKILDGEEEIASAYQKFKQADADAKFQFKKVDMYQRDLKYIDEEIERQWHSNQ